MRGRASAECWNKGASRLPSSWKEESSNSRERWWSVAESFRPPPWSRLKSLRLIAFAGRDRLLTPARQGTADIQDLHASSARLPSSPVLRPFDISLLAAIHATKRFICGGIWELPHILYC